MGKALYRKYRPKSLSEVVGQKHITDTLASAIKAGRISHAYLLTGPRGTGKTSIARILAHQLNGLEYLDDQAQLDIIEIDAASNRRIDEIRNLRDKVHILPTSSKYKVYIIDEVHMLTREAFNALLKTLEEPPEHAIFILATTEAHKLPETIVSRTQHFSFKPVDLSEVVEHLKQIADGEKFKIHPEALELIARHGEGSFRDSISLLDQARGLSDDIQAADIERLLGIAPAEATDRILQAINAGDVKLTLDTLTELRGQGFLSSQLAKQLGITLRTKIVNDSNYQNGSSLQLLNNLLGVSASAQADRLLEIALLENIFANNPSPVAQSPSPSITKPEPKVEVAQTKVEDKPKTEDKPKNEPPKEDLPEEPKEAPAPKPKVNKPQINSGFTLEAWPLVVAAIKKKYNTLYGILKMAEAELDGSELTLKFRFPFHQKQINDSKNRKIISDIIKEQTGENIEIKCTVSKKDAAKDKGTNNNALSNVSDIFGGAEVLES